MSLTVQPHCDLEFNIETGSPVLGSPDMETALSDSDASTGNLLEIKRLFLWHALLIVLLLWKPTAALLLFHCQCNIHLEVLQEGHVVQHC